MNLSKLFSMQKELDDYIVKTKGLEGKDLLPQRILALQVELGECANEWRGFKFWSENQKPRTQLNCPRCKGKKEYFSNFIKDWVDCDLCDATGKEDEGNPLLEEYVDCLHFILSIGNTIQTSDYKKFNLINKGICFYFTTLFRIEWESKVHYTLGLAAFIELGEMLGFTWNQIEEAYTAKWKINKQRQESGY